MKRQNILLITLLIGVASLSQSCQRNASIADGKTVASVGSEKITEGHLQFLAGLNPNIAFQLANPSGKKEIVNNLIEQELLYQEAKNKGVDKNPQVRAKMDLYRRVIIAQALVEKSAEDEAKKYFDTHKNEYEKMKLSHIMIRYSTPEELKAKKTSKDAVRRSEPEALKLANQIYDQLKAGAHFETVAKEKSEDATTKEQGGSLGAVAKEDLRLARRGFQPLLEKGFALKVGELAGPIKTASGYHIITATSPLEMTAFEEVKQELMFKQRNEIRDKLLADLKQKYSVVWAEEFRDKKVPEKSEVPAEKTEAPKK